MWDPPFYGLQNKKLYLNTLTKQPLCLPYLLFIFIDKLDNYNGEKEYKLQMFFLEILKNDKVNILKIKIWRVHAFFPRTTIQ